LKAKRKCFSAARQDDDAVAQVVARATGPLGTCREYLENTVAHLRDLGQIDPEKVHTPGIFVQRVVHFDRGAPWT
jgi:cation transport regulator ChaC